MLILTVGFHFHALDPGPDNDFATVGSHVLT